MENAYEKLMRCYESVKNKIDFKPRIGLVLGSGLGDYGDSIDIVDTIEYKDIEGFPVSTVPGHVGRYIFGYVGDVPIVCMQGRVHYYEGYAMSDVVLPIRLMKLMGASVLFLTNAAGGCQLGMKSGDLMAIKGQISTFVPSPLIGPNLDQLGPRFPDMSEIYDKKFLSIIKKCAANRNIDIKEGVYIQFTGPNYETPEEVAMARNFGADAIGMSTAVEAVAAKHMGMKVLGISCISNLAAGITPFSLNHLEVQETANRISSTFKVLVTDIIEEIGKMEKQRD